MNKYIDIFIYIDVKEYIQYIYMTYPTNLKTVLLSKL